MICYLIFVFCHFIPISSGEMPSAMSFAGSSAHCLSRSARLFCFRFDAPASRHGSFHIARQGRWSVPNAFQRWSVGTRSKRVGTHAPMDCVEKGRLRWVTRIRTVIFRLRASHIIPSISSPRNLKITVRWGASAVEFTETEV